MANIYLSVFYSFVATLPCARARSFFFSMVVLLLLFFFLLSLYLSLWKTRLFVVIVVDFFSPLSLSSSKAREFKVILSRMENATLLRCTAEERKKTTFIFLSLDTSRSSAREREREFSQRKRMSSRRTSVHILLRS